MNIMNDAGLDIHKKSISCCVRQTDGHHYPGEHDHSDPSSTGRVDAATVATMDGRHGGHAVHRMYLWPSGIGRGDGERGASGHAAAIAAGKKENDRMDARKIADLLRRNFIPECHMASREIRDRRRVLRYRNLLVRQAVQMKNKVSGLLMKAGVPYNQQKVHQKKKVGVE